MLLRRYEMPWRPAYEARAGALWLVAFVIYAGFALTRQMPALLAVPLAAACMAMALLRIHQACLLYTSPSPRD